MGDQDILKQMYCKNDSRVEGEPEAVNFQEKEWLFMSGVEQTISLDSLFFSILQMLMCLILLWIFGPVKFAGFSQLVLIFGCSY